MYLNDKTILDSDMLHVGTILHDTYRIDSYLASGGFGNTYVATNIHFKNKVAIKEFFMRGATVRKSDNTVSISTSDNKETFDSQRKKFKKEAQRLHDIHSQHIVSVHDFFDENGTSYYVMDFIDGESLSQRMKRTHTPLSEKEVLDVLRQVLDALSAAYRNNPPILHLDIKPGNIMVDRKGKVILIDFGASKQLDANGVAATSAIPYTNGYAPLEQMDQNPEKFGPWTDFYALGATLYNLLTNRKPPMPTNLLDDATQLKSETLKYPNGVSDKTKGLIAWMMQIKRSKRPQTVREITDYLDYFEQRDSKSGSESKTETEDKTEFVNENRQVPPSIPSTTQVQSNSAISKYVIGAIAGIVFIAIMYFFASRNMKDNNRTYENIDSVEVTNEYVQEDKKSEETANTSEYHNNAEESQQEKDESSTNDYTNTTSEVGRWPFTSYRKITDEDLYGLDSRDLRIMRNEIYARHGYVFRTQSMKEYFNSQPWYTPISREVSLSNIEMYNVEFIKQREQ